MSLLTASLNKHREQRSQSVQIHPTNLTNLDKPKAYNYEIILKNTETELFKKLSSDLENISKLYSSQITIINNTKILIISPKKHSLANIIQEINYIRKNNKIMTNDIRNKQINGGASHHSHGNNKKNIKRLNKWELDLSDIKTLSIIDKIKNIKNNIDWGIFKIKETNENNIKLFIVNKYGGDGILMLSEELCRINYLCYVLLNFEYGKDISNRVLIMIVWNPPNKGDKIGNSDIIPMLTQKNKIYNVLRATHMMTIDVYSHLKYQYILSDLNRNNKLHEILLRVCINKNIQFHKLWVKQLWTLKQLKKELSKIFKLKESLNISTINTSNYLIKPTQFDKPQTNEILLTDDNATINELGLVYGDKLYVKEKTHNKRVSMSLLSKQRELIFNKVKKEFPIKLMKILKNKQKKIQSKTNSNNNNDDNNIPTLNIERIRSNSLPDCLNKSRPSAVFSDYLPSSVSTHDFDPVLVGDILVDNYNNKNDNDKKNDDISINNDENFNLDDIKINDIDIDDDGASVLEYPSLSFSEKLLENNFSLDLDNIFIIEKDVGRGKTAQVHYAMYYDELDIALKEFKFGKLTTKIINDFNKELNTLRNLQHPNIVNLIGHYIDKESRQLYMGFEWMPGGCLYNIINDNKVKILFKDVLIMGLDISRGLKYLHDNDIIHRDLKSHNLLLDESYRVKLADFGTAKHLDEINSTTYTEVGTSGYMAPEVIDPPEEGYGNGCDIFSLAVILWELYSRKKVFDQKCLRHLNKLENGERPEFDNKCPNEYKKLVSKCWKYNAKDRPNMNNIVKSLTTMLSKLKDEEEQQK